MRSDSRSSTSIAAAVLDDAGGVLERVEIVNISAGGARLAVEAGWNLPARFTLAIPERDERRACLVRWRLTRAVGVCFAEAAAGRRPGAPAAASALRLLELEREVLRLLEENRSLTRELALHEVFRFDPFGRRAAGAGVEFARPSEASGGAGQAARAGPDRPVPADAQGGGAHPEGLRRPSRARISAESRTQTVVLLGANAPCGDDFRRLCRNSTCAAAANLLRSS